MRYQMRVVVQDDMGHNPIRGAIACLEAQGGTSRCRPMRTKLVVSGGIGRGELGQLVAARVEDVGRA
eukprot:5110746-Prymnesium_polylepis.1